MSEQLNKVCVNIPQEFTDAQKAQGRANIGAQGALTAGPNIDIYNDIISTEKPQVAAGTNVSVNSVLDPQTRVVTYTVSATDTTYNVFNTTTDGLVPKASGTGDTGKFLKGDGTWEAINAPSIVQKKDYGDTSASTVSTLLIDSDDPEGYSLLKADNSIKGYLVQGPYATLLNSGVNGIGDSSTPVYIGGNGQFATCSITPGGAKRSHTAELYFHHSQDGDHYNVRNVKNYCINHVAVTGHSGDICYVEIEAPTLDGTGEEYDYVVVFDCTNSSGSTTHVVVQNADPEIFTYPLDSTSHVVQITQTLVYFDGSVRSQIEVLGGRFTVHSY